MGPMLRVALLCAALVACQTAPPPTVYIETSQKSHSESFYRGLIESTVQVAVSCEDGNSTGSGVIIQSQWTGGSTIATAAHVADPGCEYKIRDLVFKTIARDEDYDIAILRGPRLNGKAVPFRRPHLGQEVIAVGYPYQPLIRDTALQITRGQLSAFLGERYKVSAPMYFGSSGGPVFDGTGALVGLTVSLWAQGRHPYPGEYFVTPAWRVFDMSRRFTKDFEVQELACRCGVPVPQALYPNALEITRRAQILRDSLGTPLLVVSGYRTREHNDRVGGAPRSHHLHAEALDLRSLYHTPAELADRYEALIASGEVPDGGLGIYRNHIHIDIGPAGRRWDKR